MTRFRSWEPEILAKVRSLPHAPGVYQMKDKAGRILYVGKALSLRDRVSSYFNRSPKHGENIELMLAKIADFDVLLTPTEREAFILEASLVKQFQPPYNILLKDDKTYPYIKITVGEPYPRLFITRRVEQDGSRYFGPYTSVAAMRRSLRFIANLFNLRTCSLELDGARFIAKPCLDYHLKLCSGPCANQINRDEYAELTRQAIDFFSGREQEVRKELEERMYTASRDMRYEAATRLRDILFAVKKTQDKQVLWGAPIDFFDAIGYAYSENRAIVMVIPIRGGRILGEVEYQIENELQEEPSEILDSFIQQFYSNPQHIHQAVLLPEETGSMEFAAQWMSELRGKKVQVYAPQRGRKHKLVQMAMANAAERLRTRLLGRDDEFVVSPGILRIKEVLRLDFIPRRIEGYDISHTRGDETVGSMVVFTDGKPDRAAYRSFTIRGRAHGDDLMAMREMLRRRLLRYLSDDKWYTPDSLLLIDGGRTQLDAVLDVLRGLRLEFPAGFRHDGAVDEPNGDGGEDADAAANGEAESEESVPIGETDNDENGDADSNGDAAEKRLILGGAAGRIEDHPLDRLAVAALAKREETLLHYDRFGNLLEHHLDPTDAGLSLVIAVRDESHRRAQLHHHARRDRAVRSSALDDVPGVGPQRSRMLLATYKSLKRIRDADASELAELPGMTMNAAIALKRYLMEKESTLSREWRLKDEIVELRRKPRLVRESAGADAENGADDGSDGQNY